MDLDTMKYPLQIINYLAHTCLGNDQALNPTVKISLSTVYSELIYPIVTAPLPEGKNAPKKRSCYRASGNGIHFVQAYSQNGNNVAEGIYVPITDFYSAMGYVITATCSPATLTRNDYYLILGLFGKWCWTMKAELLAEEVKTVSIIWRVLPGGQLTPAQYSAREIDTPSIFAISASLPLPKNQKEKARKLRVECLIKYFGELRVAPRMKQLAEDQTGRSVDWGHCAESLALLCTRLPDSSELAGTALTVAKVKTCEPFDIPQSAWLKACDNCVALAEVAKATYYDHGHQLQQASADAYQATWR
ncbi:hypothetical protein F5I97DRAFT_1930267 [Phlebopus sp. FC_14]|nr:hypothetical protein F5I97DRAFT_1930267 [Phlebopus sp. FC_14]